MKIVLSLIVFLTAINAFAQSPTFDNISADDLKAVVQEFAGGFVHTSATPPTSLGKVFGVEAGFIVGAMDSKAVERISKEFDPDFEFAYIPHAWILGGFSVPYGISVEVNYLPELDVEGLKADHKSVGLKWSITDQFLSKMPFDWAVRTYYTQTELSFTQTTLNTPLPGSTTANVSFKNSMVGLDNLIGFDFGVAEPYLGLGFVQTKGTLKATATTAVAGFSIFDDGVESKSQSESSMRLIAGCQFHLTLLKFSLEYSNIFSAHRLSAKLGVGF